MPPSASLTRIDKETSMILSLHLSTTTCDPGCNRTTHSTFYIAPEAVRQGISIRHCLPPQYHAFVGSIHAQALPDSTGVEIKSPDYGDLILRNGDRRTYRTPRIGLSYAYCELAVCLLPHTLPVWDELRATDGDFSAVFSRNELTRGACLQELLERQGHPRADRLPFHVPYLSHNSVQLTDSRSKDSVILFLDRPRTFRDVQFALSSHTLQLNEWDPQAARPREYLVNSRLWADSRTRAAAAGALADSIAAQCPEAHAIIADYRHRVRTLLENNTNSTQPE